MHHVPSRQLYDDALGGVAIEVEEEKFEDETAADGEIDDRDGGNGRVALCRVCESV
jgi:hypothetical protein